jgi:alkyl hydroperoxide reductase subunit AhpF
MSSESKQKLIQNTLGQMKKPVRLVVFSSDRGCVQCPPVIALAKEIKSFSAKVALEVYDIIMDRDRTELYGIQAAPALVVQGGTGRVVRFYGMLKNIFLDALLDCIAAASTDRVWFSAPILGALKLLERDVHIQVFVDNDCGQCRLVAGTAIGLALENDLIHTDIIVAGDFPDLMRKHDITTLPKTIFGGNLHMDGHVSESEFLEMIFEAEGLRSAREKRCLVCGNPSPDTICGSCKAKIQAEAIGHKLSEEKKKHSETAPRKHEKK